MSIILRSDSDVRRQWPDWNTSEKSFPADLCWYITLYASDTDTDANKWYCNMCLSCFLCLFWLHYMQNKLYNITVLIKYIHSNSITADLPYSMLIHSNSKINCRVLTNRIILQFFSCIMLPAKNRISMHEKWGPEISGICPEFGGNRIAKNGRISGQPEPDIRYIPT